MSLPSSCVNSHFSPSLSKKGTTWPVHTRKGQAVIWFWHHRCQRDLSLTVGACACVCAYGSPPMLLSKVPRETTGAEWQKKRVYSLSRPRQGKICWHSQTQSTGGQLAESRKEKWTNDMHSSVDLIQGSWRRDKETRKHSNVCTVGHGLGFPVNKWHCCFSVSSSIQQ